MKELVSIVVPIYNGELVIERCVKSLIRQNYENVEILLIDDGSKDNSLRICSKLSEHNPHIKYFHIKNGGVSNARNLGVKKAMGKWLIFVDADDTLDEDTISTAVQYQEKYCCDTVCWNSRYMKNGMQKDMNPILPNLALYSGIQIKQLAEGLYIENREWYLGDFFRACWGKLLSAQIIKENSILFPEEVKIGEDALFLVNYFIHCNKVLICNEHLYSYSISENSVIGRYKENFYKYQMSEFIVMKDLFIKYSLDAEKAGMSFWHKAEKEYIENELKRDISTYKVASAVKRYLSIPPISYYLSIYDGKGLKSRIRSVLVKMKLYMLVGWIDTLIIVRRAYAGSSDI